MRKSTSQLMVIFSILTAWGIVCADCIGGEGAFDILIKHQQNSYAADDVVDCVAMGSIRLGPEVTIPDRVVVNLVAPSISVAHEVSIETGGQLIISTRLRPINDTGIPDCSSDDTNNLDCTLLGDSHPGQDAEYGRDFSHNEDTDGHAGFSFAKLDTNGDVLPVSAANWSCVKDNVTGLIWEVKTNDAGLRDDNWTYTWYNPNSETNGGDAGVQNGGICAETDCDTHEYVQAVNNQALCGANDWRLPMDQELETILTLDRTGPTIDMTYFLNTLTTHYWSAVADANDSKPAWGIHFGSGSSAGQAKSSSSISVRLVRGGPLSVGTGAIPITGQSVQ